MGQGFSLGVVDHVDPRAVIPPYVNPEAITEVRHRDGIGGVVVATERELVAVHFAAPVWLVDVVTVVRNQTTVKRILQLFCVAFSTAKNIVWVMGLQCTYLLG